MEKITDPYSSTPSQAVQPVLKMARFREDPVKKRAEICKTLRGLTGFNIGRIERLNCAALTEDEVAFASMVHYLDGVHAKCGALEAKVPRLRYTRHRAVLVTGDQYIEGIDQQVADVLRKDPEFLTQPTAQILLQAADCCRTMPSPAPTL